ncbi:MAG TPA: hypothetical protein VG456_16345 [Candidatus Sulfopaludibacter sp.]|nr:hypothetical protein [Candidatus Sulfopaludibacter sp.]
MLLLSVMQAGAAPLSVRAEAVKPRTLVGESILIRLHVKITAALEMEAVELNRDRTRLRIVPLSGGSPLQLSGQDYLRLHHVSPMDGMGGGFAAAAGEAWNVDLDLLTYTKPLPVGRYRVELSYRYGATPDAAVQANPVEVEVAACKLVSVEYRWFGSPLKRTDLASIWTAQDGGKVRWFFQTATPADPAAVVSASEFAVTAAAPATPPRLAHLNDDPGTHFDRMAVWLDAGRICRQPVHAKGLSNKPVCVEHGLAAASARIADPPLQRGNDTVSVVVTGRDGAGKNVAAILDIAAEGAARPRTVPLSSAPLRAVVAWVKDAAELYWLAAGGLMRTNLASGAEQLVLPGTTQPEGFAIDQWLTTGTVAGALGDRAFTVDLGSGKATMGKTLFGKHIYQMVAGTEPAFLFEDAGRLVQSPAGLFAIGHSETQGFTVQALR